MARNTQLPWSRLQRYRNNPDETEQKTGGSRKGGNYRADDSYDSPMAEPPASLASGDHMGPLLGVVFRGATPEQAAQLDLIRQATEIREPGGGHMSELVRAVLLSSMEQKS